MGDSWAAVGVILVRVRLLIFLFALSVSHDWIRQQTLDETTIPAQQREIFQSELWQMVSGRFVSLHLSLALSSRARCFYFRFSAPLVISLDISDHQIIGQCAPRLLHEYWRYGFGSRHLHKIQTKTFSYVEWILSSEVNLGAVTYPEQYPLFAFF